MQKIKVVIEYTLPIGQNEYQSRRHEESHWSPNPLESWKIYRRAVELFAESRHPVDPLLTKTHLTPTITHSFWKGPGHLEDYDNLLKQYPRF